MDIVCQVRRVREVALAAADERFLLHEVGVREEFALPGGGLRFGGVVCEVRGRVALPRWGAGGALGYAGAEAGLGWAGGGGGGVVGHVGR